MPDLLGAPHDIHPWSRSITKVLSEAARKKARIIGITGHRRGTGVSLISRELAKACIGFGKSTVLIIASETDEENASSNIIKLEDEGLTIAHLSELTIKTPSGSEQYRQALEEIANTYEMVIIDLPPVGQTVGQMNSTFKNLGQSCDVLFLVCLSGVVSKPELKDCLERCKIIDVNLTGLILNDWNIPASYLLSDT